MWKIPETRISQLETKKMNDPQLSLFELQQLVKGSLDDAFSMPVWVKAEISEMTVNRSGHCYLDLIETEVGYRYRNCPLSRHHLVVHVPDAETILRNDFRANVY